MEEYPLASYFEKSDGTIYEVCDATARKMAAEGGGVNEEQITEKVNAALAAAKESGEFDGTDGSPGKDGTDGKDGVSPTVTISKSGTVTTVEITDANGIKTATINDGENGKDGADGKGISSIAANADGSWTITYTDGSTSIVNNDVLTAAIDAANTAAENAGEAAYQAMQSADFANTEGTRAEEAADKIEDGLQMLHQLEEDVKSELAELENRANSGEFDGAPGEPGISPTTSIRKADGVTTVTFTGADGEKTALINDGESGVYYGSEEPDDSNVMVWVKPDGVVQKSKDYVLIESFTLEEPTAKIMRNTEPDGTGYSFLGCVLKIMTATSEAAGTANVLFYDANGTRISGMTLNAVSTGAQNIRIKAEKTGYGYDVNFRLTGYGGYNALQDIWDVHGKSENPIGRINLDSNNANAPFPAGTTIKIYAIRA